MKLFLTIKIVKNKIQVNFLLLINGHSLLKNITLRNTKPIQKPTHPACLSPTRGEVPKCTVLLQNPINANSHPCRKRKHHQVMELQYSTTPLR